MSNNKLIYLIIICLFPLHSFSQEAVDVPVNNNKLSVGFTFSPDYAYRSLTINHYDLASLWMFERRFIEIPKLGLTTGFNLSYDFNPRFSIETGVLFSNKGEKTIPRPRVFLSEEGEFYETIATSHYHYNYIDLPIKIKYHFLRNSNSSFFVSTGISPNIFLNSIIVHKDKNLLINYRIKHEATLFPDFDRINPAIVLSFGGEVPISEKLILRVEPIYRRSITSIMKAPIHQHLYSIGLNTGVFMRM